MSRFFLFLSILLIFAPLTAEAGVENGMDADVVLGQPDFTQGTANNGGRSASTLSTPRGVATDGQRLFVSDDANNRVLIWNSFPKSSFAPADIVLGQSSFTSAAANSGGISASTLNLPVYVYTDGQRLFVADFSNNRILIWNSIPTRNFQPADVVVGQPDFVSSAADNGGQSASTLSSAGRVYSDGQRLFISDGNNRVLIWNSIPQVNFAPADVVLGQPNFAQDTANNGGRSARTLSLPSGIMSDGKRLFVYDVDNSRVLIWNSIPTVNFTPADIVLGQPDFADGTANNGGIHAASLAGTAGDLWTDGSALFVANFANNRVLVWTSIPTVNFMPADRVIGQPDFHQISANNGGRSARTFNGPRALTLAGNKLAVTDQTNHRILIFNLGNSAMQLTPQFDQGKGVLGKVFWDTNENGMQDEGEKGIEGVKVASDTGIYAITDEDGKYHYPYIETGQRLLKIDPSTLPEGVSFSTDNPRKVTVTEGILTKVSFGVSSVSDASGGSEVSSSSETDSRFRGDAVLRSSNDSNARGNDSDPLLKVSMSQDALKLNKNLSIAHTMKESDALEENILEFTITCNYRLWIASSELLLYDKNQKLLKTIPLPSPLPGTYKLNLDQSPANTFPDFYQLRVYDKEGNSDATGLGTLDESF